MRKTPVVASRWPHQNRGFCGCGASAIDTVVADVVERVQEVAVFLKIAL